MIVFPTQILQFNKNTKITFFILSLIIFFLFAKSFFNQNVFYVLLFPLVGFIYLISGKIKLNFYFLYLLIAIFFFWLSSVAIADFSNGFLFFPILILSILIVPFFFSLNFYRVLLVYYFFFFLLMVVDLLSSYSFIQGSRNQVSIFFLNFSALLLIVRFIRHGTSNSIASSMHIFATLFLCLYSIGVSGVISGTLLFLFYFFIYNRLIFLILVIVILSVLIFIFPGSIDNFLYSLFSLNNDISLKYSTNNLFGGNIRYSIIQNYLDKLDYFSFLFGHGVNFIHYNDLNNAHNTFLFLHQRLGFISFLLIFYMLYNIRQLWSINHFISLVYVILLFRSLSDTVYFAGSGYDFILLLFLFLPYYYKLRVSRL